MSQIMAKYCLSLLISLFLQLSVCFALSQDRQQPMQLSANSADINQQAHRGVFIGNVQLDQGTTHIRAASAITEGNVKNQLVKAILKGSDESPAHFWTLSTTDKPPMHAYADTIFYYPERHTIELVGHAKVIQGNDSFSADKISYDTLQQHVLSDNDSKQQTMIIIHPDKKV